MGDQTTTRTHVRRAQCSFGGEISGERDRTALISQSASCATFPQSGTNHMPPKRAVNPDNRRRPATHASSKMAIFVGQCAFQTHPHPGIEVCVPYVQVCASAVLISSLDVVCDRGIAL